MAKAERLSATERYEHEQHLFLSPFNGRMDEGEIEEALQRQGFSLDYLRGAFEEGWLDEQQQLSYDMREARSMYFHWVVILGFDPSDFDWDEWREYFSEQTP